jgi:[ribosomal protein S18]-alanine N-acetyltransferase
MLVTRLDRHDRLGVEAIAALSSELDVQAELDRSFSRIFVARPAEGEAPWGFVLAWFVADEVHIINVATHPEHRRCGVASALLKTLIERARSDRSRLVLLEVRRTNRAAIALYRAHGFRAMGVRRRYYADTDEDAIEMLLAIDPETGRVLPGRDQVLLEC